MFMGMINMGDNIFQLYGEINIGDQMFFDLWKRQHEKQLKNMHKDYNQNHTPSITYDEYSKVMFDFAPQTIEHRMN